MPTLACLCRRRGLLVALTLSAALVVACGPATRMPTTDPALVARERVLQNRLALQRHIDDTTRLQRIAWRLRHQGSYLCPQHTASLGLVTLSASQLPPQWQQLHIGRQPTVVQRIPGSPAARSDLQQGDRILALNGRPVQARHWQKALAKLQPGVPAQLTVERAGPLQIGLIPVDVCNYPVNYIADDTVNAYADGSHVVVTRGMLRFATTDRELALVVGHELAHNIMGHVRKTMGNRFLGTLVDVLVAGLTGFRSSLFSDLAALRYSQEFEAEADYVGLYMVAAAGYPLAEAANFWRRMGIENPGSINHARSHPTTPERFVAIESATAEIIHKQQQALELLPEFDTP